MYIPPRDNISIHYTTAYTGIQHCIQYITNIPHSVLISAILIVGQRVIPFTKPSKESHKKGRTGWNELNNVALEFDHTMHWHRIYLDHGHTSFWFYF